MPMPEPGRLTAHTLLDAVSVYEPVDDAMEVVDRAVARLNDIGAVRASFDDETDVLDLQLDDLIGGTLVLVKWLIVQLALSEALDQTEVIYRARAFLDT